VEPATAGDPLAPPAEGAGGRDGRHRRRQGELFWADPKDGTAVWEFGVLVSSLDLEIRSLAQLYRDRGDSENPFDELKNHWAGPALPLTT
jgi:hypothetical protein